MRNITEALVKINSIENQGDDIFDMSIEKLFATEPDAKEVIKKREIYQVMEIVTDKCEDASNVIESIIIKVRIINLKIENMQCAMPDISISLHLQIFKSIHFQIIL